MEVGIKSITLAQNINRSAQLNLFIVVFDNNGRQLHRTKIKNAMNLNWDDAIIKCSPNTTYLQFFVYNKRNTLNDDLFAKVYWYSFQMGNTNNKIKIAAPLDFQGRLVGQLDLEIFNSRRKNPLDRQNNFINNACPHLSSIQQIPKRNFIESRGICQTKPSYIQHFTQQYSSSSLNYKIDQAQPPNQSQSFGCKVSKVKHLTEDNKIYAEDNSQWIPPEMRWHPALRYLYSKVSEKVFDPNKIKLQKIDQKSSLNFFSALDGCSPEVNCTILPEKLRNN